MVCPFDSIVDQDQGPFPVQGTVGHMKGHLENCSGWGSWDLLFISDLTAFSFHSKYREVWVFS